MYTLGARSERVNLRPEKDRITISFKRFQLLRSIAYLAHPIIGGYDKRLEPLRAELEKLEIDELVGIITNV